MEEGLNDLLRDDYAAGWPMGDVRLRSSIQNCTVGNPATTVYIREAFIIELRLLMRI